MISIEACGATVGYFYFAVVKGELENQVRILPLTRYKFWKKRFLEPLLFWCTSAYSFCYRAT